MQRASGGDGLADVAHAALHGHNLTPVPAQSVSNMIDERTALLVTPLDGKQPSSCLSSEDFFMP